MNDLELLDNLLNIADMKDVKLEVKNFKSFTDIKLDSDLNNMTGSGKGNIVDEDKTIDFKKAQSSIDEIKKLFV